MADREFLSPIEEIIEDARNGRMFVLLDHEDRENEGDLVIPAQMAGPDAVNFMATHGRGLICLSLTRERVDHLGLQLMNSENKSRLETAFTVSIEAADGVTTGISASDRARTISFAIDPTNGPDDICTPGHVFPLVARDGGVLVRSGHTEAAIDVARLAGLNPSGVICEIMNDDGTMARLPELVKFAQFHGLKVATISDLIAYRLKNDSLIERVTSASVNSELGGEFEMVVFKNRVEHLEYVAFVKGEITEKDVVLVRMHSLSIFEDVLGGEPGAVPKLRAAVKAIGEAGKGVIVVIRTRQLDWASTQIKQHMGEAQAKATEEMPELRQYGIGAQILLDLGVRNMVLLSNTERNIVGLGGYGLKVVGQQRLDE